MRAPKRHRTFTWDSARWEQFAFRDGDIVISTPPKCGTTWMQMLCALLIFRTPDLPEPLARLSPWLDMHTRPLDDVLADLERQTHRRFVKSHCPLDGLPFHPDATYIHVARDPRDAAMSWDNHMANLDINRLIEFRIAAAGADDLAELGIDGPPPPPPDDPVERFWRWVEFEPGKDTPGPQDDMCLAGLVNHVTSFWDRRHEPNVHLFHYHDLRADLAGQMHRLAEILGVDPPSDDLVEAATFEQMKGRADELVPNSDTPFWKDTRRFFDRARSGSWREFFDTESHRRYDAAIEKFAPPEVVGWLHDGWLAQHG